MLQVPSKKKIMKKTDKNGVIRYYDFSTSNKSFLNLANELKMLGNKCWYFPLEIRDVSLIGVNPHAVDKEGHTTLSQDTIKRIIIEVTMNPWYYIRECARIPTAGSATGVPYIANRGNIAQTWCVLHDLDSWLNIPRQQGKTQSAICIQTWFYGFGTSSATFIFFNKEGAKARENLDRMKTQIALLPEYLRFKTYMDENGINIRGKDNATKISHPITKNTVEITATAANIDKAISLARGASAQFFHFDEAEFTPFIDVILSNSYPAFSESAKNARMNHSHAARIFTSTPGDLDTDAGVRSQKVMDNQCVPWYDWAWTNKETGEVRPSLYDMDRDKILEYIYSQGEYKAILYIEYSYKQLGRSEEWLDDMRRFIGDRLAFQREVLLQRLHGSSLSPYNQEDIEYINSTQRNPVDELWLLEYYKFDIYKPLKKNMAYLVGVDCASGGGENSDNNAITILNPNTLEPDAEFKSSYIGVVAFENLIYELVTKVIPKACVVIERNSMGTAIIQHLVETTIQKNLYRDKHKNLLQENVTEMGTSESLLKKKASERNEYGVYTSAQSRDVMFSILSNHVVQYKDKFITKNIISDLSKLVRTKSGKIAAAPGEHDDSIMSYLIALYVYYNGSNLYAYGIHPGMGEISSVEHEKRAPLNINTINPDEVNPEVYKQLQLAAQIQANYNENRRTEEKAYEDAYRHTRELERAGLLNSDEYKPDPDDDMYYDLDDDDDAISMDWFKEMNDL